MQIKASGGTDAAMAGGSAPGLILKPTWYVTFETRKSGLLRNKELRPRATRTFATETEAKDFARAKLKEGLLVFAGTINPQLPKRLIHPEGMADWVDETTPKDE